MHDYSDILVVDQRWKWVIFRDHDPWPLHHFILRMGLGGLSKRRRDDVTGDVTLHT